LNKDVRGELDWIVMKCIEKDRKRRYESANGIAADIERYLNNETVQACPPSRSYQFRKFVRRNKAALGIASAAALALLIGVVGLSASNAQIKREQKQTEQALFSEQEAKNDLTKSLEREQQVLSFQRFGLAERELMANNIGAAEELLHEVPEDLRGFEWRLLKGLHTGPQVLRGNGAGLLDVAISPDGRLVASADLDSLKNAGQLMLWDGANGRKIATLSGHHGPVACVVFSPNGKHLASFGSDRAINIWDVETHKVVRTLAGYRAGHGGCLAFSPDGTSLAFASWDQGVRVWDLATGDEKLVYRGHRGIVTCVAFSPDGRSLASGGSDGAVRLWDARTGKDLLQLSGQSAWIFSLAVSPDGTQVVSAGAAGLCAWDANTGQNILPAQGITKLTLRAKFSHDGKRLIAGHQDGTVRIWDLETGQETLVLRRHSNIVSSVAISADGSRLVSASLDGTACLWYPPPAEQTAETPRVLRGHTGQVMALAFSPDHRRLASSGLDGTVRIWDVTTGKAAHTLQAEHVLSLGFSTDGEQLTTVSFEGSMTHWNVSTGQTQRALPRHLGQVLTTNMTVAFRPDGQQLASVADENTVKVWDVSTGQEEWKMIPPIGSPHALILAYSADGRQLAGAAPGAIRIWDATNGKELHSIAGPAQIVLGLAFHPDGHQLATTSGDGLLTLWDVDSGKALHKLPTSAVICVTYSPDGRRLASGGGDNTVQLWDSQTGEQLATLRGHIGAVWSLAYSGDGKILATASGNKYRGEIQLWDTAALEKKQND
jgi:WD40 repeat protein